MSSKKNTVSVGPASMNIEEHLSVQDRYLTLCLKFSKAIYLAASSEILTHS